MRFSCFTKKLDHAGIRSGLDETRLSTDSCYYAILSNRKLQYGETVISDLFSVCICLIYTDQLIRFQGRLRTEKDADILSDTKGKLNGVAPTHSGPMPHQSVSNTTWNASGGFNSKENVVAN